MSNMVNEVIDLLVEDIFFLHFGLVSYKLKFIILLCVLVLRNVEGRIIKNPFIFLPIITEQHHSKIKHRRDMASRM